MAVHVLNSSTFRLAFPEFRLETDASLQVNFGMATAYFGDVDGLLLEGQGLQSCLELMTAHILKLSQMAANGETIPGPVTSSRIDRISVQFAAPPYKDGWSWWLSQTPYGVQLWALLSMLAGGGLYIGGAPERDAFRTVYGY